MKIQKSTNNDFLMVASFVCIIYALFVLEWDYLDDTKNHHSTEILSVGYFLGIISCITHAIRPNSYIIRLSFVYLFIILISIAISPPIDDTIVLFDMIKNSTWIVALYMAYIWGVKNYNFKIALIFVNYIALPLLYIVYYLILTKTFFSGEYYGFRDAIFAIAVLTPFPLFCENNKVRNMHIIIFLLLIILSAKRSVIIGVVLGLMIFFSKVFKDSRHKSRILILLTIAIFAVIIFVSFSNINFDIFSLVISRFDAMEDGNTNGRDSIMDVVLASFYNSDVLTQLLGHGSQSTILVVGKLAHNDFLQVLYDYGIISLFLIVAIYILLIREGYRAYFKYSFAQKDASIFCFNLVLFICLGMLNCYISSPRTFTVTMFIFGYLIGQFRYKKRRLDISRKSTARRLEEKKSENMLLY